jgi:hypothetical protein
VNCHCGLDYKSDTVNLRSMDSFFQDALTTVLANTTPIRRFQKRSTPDFKLGISLNDDGDTDPRKLDGAVVF